MLVLSRRPNEKILFPSVGISVEIVQTKGNTVRVGIKAPEDIRILRGELEGKESGSALMQMNRMTISQQSDVDDLNPAQRASLVNRLEEIAMAVALAQNQQRQGLAQHVELALDQAIDQIGALKQLLQPLENCESAVCETRPAYKTRNSGYWLSVDSRMAEFRYEFECVI